ncbi:TetR family transcriptional regulator [Pseudomonas sp. M47T1]|nr:TetR/AcrR family transcriptional regulator [Pseudomonas sp. M47T1]EIK95477.1 TetR family transcriptional regulator [Pseudomonas sp. M47T1]
MYIMPFDPKLDAAPAPQLPVRELILHAACQVFAHEGYAAATVSGIAAKAGLPKPNVLYYFKSKDKLYAQVLESIAAPYMDACLCLRAGDEPVEALTRTVLAMVRLFERQPFASKVFMVELKEGATRLPPAYAERWSTRVRDSVDCLRHWVDRGLLASMDPEHLLLSIWAIAQSCISLGWQVPALRGRDQLEAVDYAAATQTATRLLLQGLLPAPADIRRKRA